MHFAIDIDQTICGSNAHQIYATFHNEDLHLEIPQETLKHISSYHDFVMLPQVRIFYQQHPREWNLSRHRAIATPHVLQSFLPIDGAIQAMKQLSHYGTIGYYTARIPEVQAVTQHWLEDYGFEQSENVVCCTSIEQKMITLGTHMPEETITLIDDRGHTHVLNALLKMQEDECIQKLLARLTILAFGAETDSIPEVLPCNVLALPTWDQLPKTNIYA